MSRPKLLFLMVYDAAVVIGGTAIALVIGVIYLLPKSLWAVAMRKTNGAIEWVALALIVVVTVLLIHFMGIDSMLELLRQMFDHDCPNPKGFCL